VVMTQACDLEHDKVENVVLCPHDALSVFRQTWERSMQFRGQVPSEKAWRRPGERLCLEPVFPEQLRRCDSAVGATRCRFLGTLHDAAGIPRIAPARSWHETSPSAAALSRASVAGVCTLFHARWVAAAD
jgi:hypothetical protein